MASASTPFIRPLVHKREKIERYRKDLRFCFIANYVDLWEGRCKARTCSNYDCLNSLSQWPDDVMKVVLAADNPALHSEPLEYEIDQIATYFLCGKHHDRAASRQYWLGLFAAYREYFHVDIEMVDV